jgi:hypothetical protein
MKREPPQFCRPFVMSLSMLRILIKVNVALMVESRQTLKGWKMQAQQYLAEGRFRIINLSLRKCHLFSILRRQKQVEMMR